MAWIDIMSIVDTAQHSSTFIIVATATNTMVNVISIILGSKLDCNINTFLLLFHKQLWNAICDNVDTLYYNNQYGNQIHKRYKIHFH